jgi:hypothetical protein
MCFLPVPVVASRRDRVVDYLSTGLTVGFIVGFGLLAALIVAFPLVTPPAGL